MTDTAVEVIEKDGTTRSVDVAKGEKVWAPDLAARNIIAQGKAKLAENDGTETKS